MNFNKASHSYDTVAHIQRHAAEFLFGKLLALSNCVPKTILDLGTGTGYIPELLLLKYPDSSYYLNDIAYEMLERCRVKFSKYPNIHYLHQDMLQLNTNSFDLVISNLALQWADDLWSALHLLHSKSSKIFAFSTLLEGTFKEWEDIINRHQDIRINSYPQSQEVADFCNNIKSVQAFDHWTIDISIPFDNPLTFIHYLKSLGASASKNPIGLSNLRSLLFKNSKKYFIGHRYCVFFFPE